MNLIYTNKYIIILKNRIFKVYDTKTNEYFSRIRLDLLELIPKKYRNGNLLEVGAGSGNTLLFAKQNYYASSVSGIDIQSIEDSYQSSPEIHKFIIANIEQDVIPFKNKSFDVILCGDVLEHLVDPWKTIQKLKSYLSTDGIIIASIPNFREINTLKKICFSGNFQYEESGVLDKTHLRFFCKKNVKELFSQNGMQILLIQHSLKHSQGKRLLLNKLTFGVFEEFLTVQYHVVAKQDIPTDINS